MHAPTANLAVMLFLRISVSFLSPLGVLGSFYRGKSVASDPRR
jgi:hypothetical protein